MSFDLFVQGFHRGAARDADATALREALSPYLVDVANGWSLRVGTSTAEIYGVEALTSFMVTHVDGAEVYDVIVRVAFQLDLVILAPGAPVGVTRAEQQEHLPDEIRNDAKLVASGPELIALIESA